MRWVSIARRRMRRPSSRSCSQIGVSHSAGPPLSSSAPQMSLTSTSMWPCSSRTRVGERRHLRRVEVVDRDRDPRRRPSAVDELGGLLDGLGPVVVGPHGVTRLLRPVQKTVAPASPSAVAIPRPAPRRAGDDRDAPAQARRDRGSRSSRRVCHGRCATPPDRTGSPDGSGRRGHASRQGRAQGDLPHARHRDLHLLPDAGVRVDAGGDGRRRRVRVGRRLRDPPGVSRRASAG